MQVSVRAEACWLAEIWAKAVVIGGEEARARAERAGLLVTDIEVLRLHYAETLRCWYERFLANRAEIAALYDERFCRMWEFYLAGSEMAFKSSFSTYLHSSMPIGVGALLSIPVILSRAKTRRDNREKEPEKASCDTQLSSTRRGPRCAP